VGAGDALFVRTGAAAPLPIRGGTGPPENPVARGRSTTSMPKNTGNVTLVAPTASSTAFCFAVPVSPLNSEMNSRTVRGSRPQS
jgi:hypothetical protein